MKHTTPSPIYDYAIIGPGLKAALIAQKLVSSGSTVLWLHNTGSLQHPLHTSLLHPLGPKANSPTYWLRSREVSRKDFLNALPQDFDFLSSLHGCPASYWEWKALLEQARKAFSGVQHKCLVQSVRLIDKSLFVIEPESGQNFYAYNVLHTQGGGLKIYSTELLPCLSARSPKTLGFLQVHCQGLRPTPVAASAAPKGLRFFGVYRAKKKTPNWL